MKLRSVIKWCMKFLDDSGMCNSPSLSVQCLCSGLDCHPLSHPLQSFTLYLPVLRFITVCPASSPPPLPPSPFQAVFPPPKFTALHCIISSCGKAVKLGEPLKAKQPWHQFPQCWNISHLAWNAVEYVYKAVIWSIDKTSKGIRQV